MVFIKTLQIKKTKKCFCFHAYDQVSKKNHIVFSYKENFLKQCFSMHFDFNNQFIKVVRTKPIFFKKSFYFLLVFEITNLYVKRILDIKKVFLLLT